MTPELRQRLESCESLPSPPGVATQILALANDPDADISKIAKILAIDPAITTKILRVANSAMYAQPQKTENVRQAIVFIGLDATISLALSFSLLKTMHGEDAGGGLDYQLFWRRALLAATVSPVLARAAKINVGEELFLASLIQDIGMLALDRSVPEVYEGLEQQIYQESVTQTERERVGVDHAVIGGWLLDRWHFPARIQQAVAASHTPDSLPEDHENASFVRCVALSSLVAEVFLDATGERAFQNLADAAQQHLDIDKEQLGELLHEVGELIPEAEQVFETQILADCSADSVLEQAREALMLRSLQALQAVDTLEDETQSLEYLAHNLEETNRRDGLTGLYNRRYLDTYLTEAFRQSTLAGKPLSIAFADLDKFKLVNDNYGHQAGDQVLETAAQILVANVRDSDIVARYGGEEFIIVLPDTDSETLDTICHRIVNSFRGTQHDVGKEQRITVTISIGMATHHAAQNFGDSDKLIEAADKALYSAKATGRDKRVLYDPLKEADPREPAKKSMIAG